MLRDNLHEPFQVILKEPMEVCPRPEHKHSFYELVYVVSGSGKHCINRSKFAYRSGHIFLLTPYDSHYFDIETSTQFLFIRFDESYIQSVKEKSDTMERIEFILKSANHEPGCLIKNESDRIVLRPIAEAIVREYSNTDLFNKELIHQFVHTLLILVARNIANNLPKEVDENTEEKTLDILQYIQENIYHPEKIRAEYISKEFGISESYLGRYFKKHSQETMQQYITNYKLRLIENRLLHSSMRIREIADELGFTDESHLNRLFRKYKGKSPSAYRKDLLKPGDE